MASILVIDLTCPLKTHSPQIWGVEIHAPNFWGESLKNTCFTVFSGAPSLNLGGEIFTPRFGGYGFSGSVGGNLLNPGLAQGSRLATPPQAKLEGPEDPRQQQHPSALSRSC